MVGIFILCVFIICIMLDIVILRLKNIEHPAFDEKITNEILRLLNFTVDIPTEIFFSKAHSWVQKNRDGYVKIGIDDFLVKTFGKFQITNFAEVKKEIKKGDTIFEISANKKLIQISSPINGRVKAINENIVNKIITNPYSQWGILLEPINYKNDIKKLFKNNDTVLWMKEELSKFKNFLKVNLDKASLAGPTMYDGGSIMEGVISFLSEKEIKDYKNQFLKL